jgi:ketosteroid isomerase-like protein
MMADRGEIDRLMRKLYAAKTCGDFHTVCELFSNDAEFRISSASSASPVAVSTTGAREFRPLLALLIRAFRLSDVKILSMIIDGSQAAVHWQADIKSRITGATVPTELIDLVEIRDGRITSFNEFFVPR